tara:strand:- start:36012 stop:36572 length:561 start_codon:yes stop_codon:yes gene_type:complete
VSEKNRIKKRVIEILKNKSIGDVDNRIFPRRSSPQESEDLPCINIYPSSESIERHNESPKEYRRVLQMEIEIESTHNTDELLSDELDALAQEVEDAIEGTRDLYGMKDKNGNDGLINDYELLNIQYDTEGGGMSPLGSVRLTYNFEYYTNEDRTEILNDLKTIDNDWRANNNTDGDAKDQINFEGA